LISMMMESEMLMREPIEEILGLLGYECTD